MIGFVLPNEGSDRPLQDFAVTVDAVEELTGLDFFPLLSQEAQHRLESNITIEAWQWEEEPAADNIQEAEPSASKKKKGK